MIATKRLAYLPGLDGMRAAAVLAVLLYHSEPSWLPGGFLGVDVFFVISGYLITSILLAEWRERGRLSLGRFWLGRARRLLGALFFMIVAVLAVAVLFLPDEVAGLREDALAAAGYITNWYLIFDHQPYFESFGRPSLLRHLWSLAVEEQYYIVWPLLLAAGLKLLRPRFTMLATLALAGASIVLMAVLYQPDGDHSRIYYGTDTRAAGLLIGSALAFFWAPGRLPALAGRASALSLELAGVVALGLLAGLHFWLDESRPFLFLGGFALVDLAAAVTIAVAAHPRARLGRLLGVAPLRWVGLRSYALYLWHWPVFMLTRPHLDVPLDGLPLLAVRLGVTLALADVSYRLVETPIRGGVLGRVWNGLSDASLGRRWRLRGLYTGAATAAVVPVFLLGVFVAGAQRPAPPPELALEEVRTGVFAAAGEPLGPPLPFPTLTTGAEPTAVPSPDRGSTPTQPPPPSPIPTATVTAPDAIALGDSVMLGAAPLVTQAVRGVSIDAAISRQVSAGIATLRRWQDDELIRDVVIIHLGNNGTFTDKQFDQIMQVLRDVRLVVFVNLKVTRPWEGPNNEVLANGVERYDNAVLVDWHASSANRPEIFLSDGTHLRYDGARLYAALIAAALAEHPAPTPTPQPTAQPTPTATPKPKPTPTPVPTATPKPTPSPAPTPSPTPPPGPTPSPTVSPSPSPSPAPPP